MKARWLVDECRVWYRLWSVWLAILAALFGALAIALPAWQIAIAPMPFAILSTLCAVGAAVARVIRQEVAAEERRRVAGEYGMPCDLPYGGGCGGCHCGRDDAAWVESPHSIYSGLATGSARAGVPPGEPL